MSEKILKVGSFFSGIGAAEKALDRLKKENIINDFKVEFFSEIDKNAIKSFCAIHNISEELNLGDIASVKGVNLPYCDLWIGGFPCQDISIAGKMKGFDNKSSTRSSLGWEMIRLLKETREKPRYVIFENVAIITSKKYKKTLELFKRDLKDLGYNLYDDLLCATDYEIPQTRKRYFLVAKLDKNEFRFPDKIGSDVKLYKFLEDEVDDSYYCTNNYKKADDNIIYLKSKKDNSIRYKVYVDKYYNGGICGEDLYCKFAMSKRIYSPYKYCPTLTANNTADNAKIALIDTNGIKIRKLTEKECWRLMGFDDKDYEKAQKVCSKTNLYHQAGNSIVVNILYYLFKELL